MREKRSAVAGSNLGGWPTALAAVIALTTVLACQSTTANEGKTADASSPLASTDPAGRLAVVVDGKSVAPIGRSSPGSDSGFGIAWLVGGC